MHAADEENKVRGGELFGPGQLMELGLHAIFKVYKQPFSQVD